MAGVHRSWTTTSSSPKIICTTNATESLKARYRRALRARGHFPNDQAALTYLNLVTRALNAGRHRRARWAIRWKPALHAFTISFADRVVPNSTNYLITG